MPNRYGGVTYPDEIMQKASGNPDDTDELGQDETPHTIDKAAQGLYKNTKIISSFFV